MNPNLSDALNSIDEAREALEQAINSLRDLQRAVPALRARMDSYLISTLEQALSDDNKWLGGANSCNLATLEADIRELFAE